LTKFGRMCAALGIRVIPASSPQAKGRIERNHGTHQVRLVKKLRRKGLADLDAANAFSRWSIGRPHQRFARPPASSDDFHVAIPRGVRLDAVFRLADTRTVSNDWVVRYDNRYFQLERQSRPPPARASVQVYEAADGQIEIRYRDRAMRCQELTAELSRRNARPRQRRTAPAPSAPPPGAPAAATAGPECRSSLHHVVAQYETGKQLAAARRAWERVQP
jgi:hypothetical protein